MLTDAEKKELEAYIDLAIDRTIHEYKKNGLLKEISIVAYSSISTLLFDYYSLNMEDEAITQAIDECRQYSYFDIIPLYYQKNYTNEELAEYYGVDVSTIVRNKKKLCLRIYEKII